MDTECFSNKLKSMPGIEYGTADQPLIENEHKSRPCQKSPRLYAPHRQRLDQQCHALPMLPCRLGPVIMLAIGQPAAVFDKPKQWRTVVCNQQGPELCSWRHQRHTQLRNSHPKPFFPVEELSWQGSPTATCRTISGQCCCMAMPGVRARVCCMIR